MPPKQESKPITSTTSPVKPPFLRSGCCKATTDILVILFVCGVLALGISAVITYFDDEITGETTLNLSSIFLTVIFLIETSSNNTTTTSWILLILFFCGVLAIGVPAAVYHYYHRLKRGENSLTSPYHYNPLQPHQLAYIWPQNVIKIINGIVDNNMHVTNDDRAVLLKTELMRFDTGDVFYIIVYDGTSGPANHAFAGINNEYISVFKPGKCNVVVYRSRFWRSSPSSALSTIAAQVEEVCKSGIAESSDYSDFPKIAFKHIDNISFLGIIGREHNVAVTSANSFGRIWGPGWWDAIPVFQNGTLVSTGKEFILIAVIFIIETSSNNTTTTSWILLILFFCGVLAIGVPAAVYHYYCRLKRGQDSLTSSYYCSPLKPHKWAYIWPQSVKKIINDVVDNNLHVTNDDRSVLLKTELMRFDTGDVFYIIVYDGTSGPANHAFAGVENEFIAVFKPGKCNVVVLEKAAVTESSDYSTFPKNSFKLIDDIRFLGIFGKEHNVSVRSANSYGRAWGPGYWETMPVFRNGTKEATGKQFILVAGFK
ncbi:hypothetical protein CRE_19987 [Caenorhabditis remanei]|uniref:Uncharacterized protein n=1 Tax=Caenorhabditis remanei TaxID=31234 RepID=E3NCD7_CAERE|nr:hypothetical protein CRE_19987 [Caenorhabditis remanei]